MGRLVSAVAAGVLAGVLAAPPAALAHGTLATSTPANGSTVQERVDTVSMTFTEQPAPYAYFTVTAPTGARVDAGWSNGQPAPLAEPVREYQLTDGEWKPLMYATGFPVAVRVSHWPAPGPYVVTYHNVATDGDTVKGELKFTYHGPVTVAPPGWQAPADQPKPELLAAEGQARPSASAQAAQAPPPQPAEKGSVWVWLVPVLLVVAVGLGLWLLVPRRRRRSRG